MKIPGMEGLRVLIMDDEEGFALTLAARLELRGMTVTVAVNAEDGLSHLSRCLPDLLLLDMRMPGLSGVEVLRRLRKEETVPGGKRLPVIIITGHCAETERLDAEALGIQGYHAKPLDMDDLLTSIDAVIKEKGT
ncbi:response regulator [Desulfosarcina sp. OttesenSCG-928-G17]|nr:response regulator [Desulfosarcina sp. OttesenSCG-928-G17]